MKPTRLLSLVISKAVNVTLVSAPTLVNDRSPSADPQPTEHSRYSDPSPAAVSRARQKANSTPTSLARSIIRKSMSSRSLSSAVVSVTER
jgi:N-acyl-L-homoserine lactone synthetase